MCQLKPWVLIGLSSKAQYKWSQLANASHQRAALRLHRNEEEVVLMTHTYQVWKLVNLISCGEMKTDVRITWNCIYRKQCVNLFFSRPAGTLVQCCLLHREREVSWCALALSDEEGPVVPLFVEHLLCFGPRNLPEEPPGERREPIQVSTGQDVLLHSRAAINNHSQCWSICQLFYGYID